MATFGTKVRPSTSISLKLQLHDAIYRLRFYSNSLIHILSLSNLHNNVASIQKDRDDKSHCVIAPLAAPGALYRCINTIIYLLFTSYRNGCNKGSHQIGTFTPLLELIFVTTCSVNLPSELKTLGMKQSRSNSRH